MSKYVKGNHVRVTDPAHPEFDQVGEVVEVLRELNQWLYIVRFGIAHVPVPERHLILAVAPSEDAGESHSGELYVMIHGQPTTQGSKKAFIRGKKAYLVEMDPKLPAWRDAVSRAAKAAAGPGWDHGTGP